MYVCLCKSVTDHEIRALLESPLINDVDDVGAACGAGTGCGSCRDEIRQLCDEARVRPELVGMVHAEATVTEMVAVAERAVVVEQAGAEVAVAEVAVAVRINTRRTVAA